MSMSRAMPTDASRHNVTVEVRASQRTPPEPAAYVKAIANSITDNFTFALRSRIKPKTQTDKQSLAKRYGLQARAKRAFQNIAHRLFKLCMALVERGGRTQNQPHFCILKTVTRFG